MNLTRKVTGDFRRVLLATMFFGATSGIFLSTLNNYLSEVHGFDAGNRGWLEFPRELPGFLIFVVIKNCGSILKSSIRKRPAFIGWIELAPENIQNFFITDK